MAQIALPLGESNDGLNVQFAKNSLNKIDSKHFWESYIHII